MITLKPYQETAKKSLNDKLQSYLGRGNKQQIYFEAPTGAGKTVVMSAMLDEFTYTLPTNYGCSARQVAYIWIAPNQLHIQSYERIKLFTEHSRHLNPIYWDDVDHTLGQLKHGDILFVNWESVVNERATMRRDTESQNGLLEVVRSTSQDAKIAVVLIIDEEHEHTRNARQTDIFLFQLCYDLEIRISATPNYEKARQGYDMVKIPRHEVVEDGMIKKDVVLNPDFQRQYINCNGDDLDLFMLQMALAKRLELKEAYRQAGYPDVNPLLLVQLPNDNSETMNDKDNAYRQKVESYLASQDVDITTTNGKLAVWLSNEKVGLDNIAYINDVAEVLLFKAAIAKGWDCPRAAVLLIYRETNSASFTIQTVGRILRMPHQKHYADDRLNHGYVFSNIANDHIEIGKDATDYICKFFAKRCCDRYQLTLIKKECVEKKVRSRLGSDYRKVLFSTFVDLWGMNQLQLDFENNYKGTGNKGDVPITNRAAAVKKGINLDARKIMLQIPTDLEMLFDNMETIEVDASHRVGVARTQQDVDKLFDVFCSKHVHPFAVYDSAPVLRRALVDFMNDYLKIFETDAMRIILHSDNRSEFEAVITESLRRYKTLLETRMNMVSTNTIEWHLPIERIYDGATHHMVESKLHVLEPYYELVGASQPEQSFRQYLDKQESVEWWYKNGDKGSEHFCIVYTNSQGRQANFYVDYIVHLRNGVTLLFDTKSPNGDAESVNKHNALREYIRWQNDEAGRRLKGGIIVQEGDNWLFAQGTISTMQDKSGWSSLNDYLNTQTHKQ